MIIIMVAMKRCVFSLVFVAGLSAQEPIFREEAKVEAVFNAEVFMSGIYIQGAMEDLSGTATQSEGDMFNAGRVRVSSYITLNNQFTLGMGALYNGILSGQPLKNPILLSEGFVQADTFVLPMGMLGVLRVGRQIFNYGEGILISDYYGIGHNGIKMTFIPSPEWDYWFDIVYADLSEGGALQRDTFYLPVELTTDTSQVYEYIYTKYQLDMLGLVGGKAKAESNYAFNLYFLADLEDRGLSGGWRPMWAGGYLEVGPLGGFVMAGEVGWLFGKWEAQQFVYYDFSDQLYSLLKRYGIQDPITGYKFSASAFDVRAYYQTSDMFTLGVSYHSFSGDNGATGDIYEGWFPPCLRSTSSPNTEWIHWAGFGEVMTWDFRPDMWRTPFFFNPTDISVVNGNIIFNAFPVKYSLVMRLDFYAYLEQWTPASMSNYIGSEIDVSLKGTYADLADVGFTFGYFMPGDRLTPGAPGTGAGWTRPTPLNLYLTTGGSGSQQLTLDGNAFTARLWVYRKIAL